MKISVKHRLLIKQILKFLGVQVTCFFILYVFKLSVAIYFTVGTVTAREASYIHICLIIQFIFWIFSLIHYLRWEKKISYIILILGLFYVLILPGDGIYKIPTIIQINNPLPLLIYDIDIIITLNIYLFVMSIAMYYAIVSIRNKLSK